MNWLRHGVLAAALALAACGQQQAPQQDTSDVTTPAEDQSEADAIPDVPEVDPALLAAPNADFTAIEPSEVGVFGAPTVMQAMAPLLGPEVTEGASVSLSVRETGDEAVADLVRSGLADDSVGAGHVRIEFRREADGWYPTNAYRRSQCRRGALADQWTTELCP
jgi:hypothetical protein